jgi:hypothetical protein
MKMKMAQQNRFSFPKLHAWLSLISPFWELMYLAAFSHPSLVYHHAEPIFSPVFDNAAHTQV